MADQTEPKPPLYKRLWSIATNLESARSILMLLVGLGGGSASVAGTAPSLPSNTPLTQYWSSVVAVFCLGAAAAVVTLRGLLLLAPHISRWWARAFRTPPFLKITPLGGTEAVIEIENLGGKCSLVAWGRIVGVSDDRQSKKRDSFPMLWRVDWDGAFVQAPLGAVLKKDQPPLKLVVAGHEIIALPDGVATVLTVFGGPGKVDAIHIDPKYGSPKVTIEVKLAAEPPLRVPFARRFEVEIEPGYRRIVEIKEVNG